MRGRERKVFSCQKLRASGPFARAKEAKMEKYSSWGRINKTQVYFTIMALGSCSCKLPPINLIQLYTSVVLESSSRVQPLPGNEAGSLSRLSPEIRPSVNGSRVQCVRPLPTPSDCLSRPVLRRFVLRLSLYFVITAISVHCIITVNFCKVVR